MQTFLRQFTLWRHYKIKTASLVIVLLMMAAYYRGQTNVLMQTYGLVRNVNIKANITHTQLPQHNHTKIDHKMKPNDIDGNETFVNTRQHAAIMVENIPGYKQFVKASLTRKTKLPPLDKYWARILHFVPEENSQNCLNLFTTESSQSTTVTPEWEKIRASAQMSEFRRSFAPQHMKLTLTYQELARLEFVHTVCEIGFNVGQSAITWLTAKPDLKLYSFDIGGELPEKMGQALEGLFPDRFNLTIGDSTKTVPLWVEQGVKCDILFIDGGHSYPIAHADILNMQKAAAKQHIIVLDDIYFPGVNKAWKEMLKKGVVHHLFDCYIKGQDIDFALGHYKNVE